jgi:hypothetical protein
LTLNCLSVFASDLKTLKASATYSDVCEDIKKLIYRAKTLDGFYSLNRSISGAGSPVRTNKVSLPNAQQKWSSVEGYRLILVANKRHDMVTLLHIYPKKGHLGKSTLLPPEAAMLLRQYAAELKVAKLIPIEALGEPSLLLEKV